MDQAMDQNDRYEDRDDRDDAAGQSGQSSAQDQGLLAFGRQRVSQELSRASDILRDATQNLDQDTAVCRMAHRAVETIADAGKYIDTADPRQIIRDANTFAHRRPEVFLGGAFLGGLMLGRFLRSRPPESRLQRQDEPVSGGMGYLGQMRAEDSAHGADTHANPQGEVTHGG